MTCDEWRAFLQDYVDGALSGPAQNAIDRHLSECAGCFADARAHKQVAARLAGEPLLEPPAGLVDRVMKELQPVGSWKREVWRLAAAAALLIGLGSVVIVGFKAPRVATPSLKAPLESAGQTIEQVIQKAGY